jgi:tRNA(adenine34) deaminase
MTNLWNRLSLPWQGCLEEAWTAYCMGSLPIGAVLTDADGHILARGRNRFYEQSSEGSQLSGHRLAHAEINTLLQVDWQAVDPRTCVLYTTTEPCPLCVGAIRLTRVGEVRYASRDGAGGSADLFQANAYLQRGRIKVLGPDDADLEVILVALLIEVVLARAGENALSLIELLASQVPLSPQLGQHLFATGQLRRWKDEGRSASFVFEQLAAILKQIDTPKTDQYPWRASY